MDQVVGEAGGDVCDPGDECKNRGCADVRCYQSGGLCVHEDDYWFASDRYCDGDPNGAGCELSQWAACVDIVECPKVFGQSCVDPNQDRCLLSNCSTSTRNAYDNCNAG